MVVSPAVTAGAMISVTVGETSAIFLVVTTMKSNGLRPSLPTSGTELRTGRKISRSHQDWGFLTGGGLPSFHVAMIK